MLEAFKNAKQKFQYPEEIHISHRQTAGQFLASSGLKKNMHYSVEHNFSEIVYRFKNERDRLIFQMWKPVEINKEELNRMWGMVVIGKIRRLKQRNIYTITIPSTASSITQMGRSIANSMAQSIINTSHTTIKTEEDEDE